MHAQGQKRSTAHEGQSTAAVTPQYRGSALAPDLKNPRPQIITSSVGLDSRMHALSSDVASVLWLFLAMSKNLQQLKAEASSV